MPGTIDCSKLRTAIRKMANAQIYYLLDEALDMLPEKKLAKLVGRYLNLRSLQPDSTQKANLLVDVKSFEKASLRGDYYESFAVNSKNYLEISGGTRAWIAECHRLLTRCVAEIKRAEPAATHEAFEIIFGLLRHIVECLDDVVFFADEAGSWQVANLYLGSLGLPGLDGKPVRFVGLSEETTFFVSMDYFEEKNSFADYVVHEAAHVFHNWKRDRAGLHHTREREFLLPISFAKRELFAFACEAYSRILEQSKSPADRQRLHADYAARWIPAVDDLDQTELADILAEAVAVRNGWKRILRRCSPPDISRPPVCHVP